MSRAISISLRSFDESVRKGYLRLFPGDPDKSAQLLNWRSHANPHGEAKFAVATDRGEVVGMIALIPTRLRGLAGICLGYQAVDTAVDPAYRGQGLFVKMGAVDMDFTYVDHFGEQMSTGYERLLFDCMIGDATLFQRADMVEASWNIVTPILDVWSAIPARDFPNYAAGSWGPAEADEMLERDGRKWKNEEAGDLPEQK